MLRVTGGMVDTILKWGKMKIGEGVKGIQKFRVLVLVSDMLISYIHGDLSYRQMSTWKTEFGGNVYTVWR